MVGLVILPLGLLIGWLARLIVPGRYRLNWAETTVLGIAGAGVGALAGNVLFHEGVDDLNIVSIVGALFGAVLVLVAAEFTLPLFGKARLSERAAHSHARATVAELVAGGEDEQVEFKTSARYNPYTGKRDERLEHVVLKSVAGFMNAEGGALLVGVDDDGNAVGLEGDLSLVKRGDHDRYILWIVDLLSDRLGRAEATNVAIDFETFDGLDVCRLDVHPARQPVFVRGGRGERTADFFVRIGNSTRLLLTDEALEYTRQHFD